MNETKRKFFETRIQPLLEYIGTIGAVLTSIAYLIIVFVLVRGFEVHKILETTVFAVVNAIVGLIIMQFLKIQGISFAKNLDENKVLLSQYYATKTKDKKARPIGYFWLKTIIKDVLIKGVSIAATSIGLIYISIKGSNDYRLLALAVVNLILFICFGLLSLNSAYEYFNNSHMIYIKEKLEEINDINK